MIAGGLLARAGSDELQSTWLPRIASGDAIATLAWHEAGRTDDAEGLRSRPPPTGTTSSSDGTKIVVPFASSADALLVLVREDAGVSIVLVPTDADGLALEQTTVADSSAQYEVRFDGVASRRPTASARRDGLGHLPRRHGRRAGRRRRHGRRRHPNTRCEMTVDYANERVQFGVPIGNFQGVAHPIADMATEIEGARTLVLQAAWARAEHGTGGALHALAKRFACETYRRATRCAHQVYGGIGFTRAIDVQLYFRRAKQLELDWFEPRTLADRIAVAELDDERPLVGVDAGI